MDELDGLMSTVASHLTTSSAQSTRSTVHDLGAFATTSVVPPLPALFPESPSETTIVGTSGTQDLQGFAAHPVYADTPADMAEESRLGAAHETPATSLVADDMGVVRSAQCFHASFHRLTFLQVNGEIVMGDSATRWASDLPFCYDLVNFTVHESQC